MALPMRFDMSNSDGVRKTNRARVMRLIHDSHGVGVRVATNLAIKNKCSTSFDSFLILLACLLFVF